MTPLDTLSYTYPHLASPCTQRAAGGPPPPPPFSIHPPLNTSFQHNITTYPLITHSLNTPISPSQPTQCQWYIQTESHHTHQSLHLHRRIPSRVRPHLLAHDLRDISVRSAGESRVACSCHQFLLEHHHDLFFPGRTGFHRYVVTLS